jgi:hypothetical protein
MKIFGGSPALNRDLPTYCRMVREESILFHFAELESAQKHNRLCTDPKIRSLFTAGSGAIRLINAKL